MNQPITISEAKEQFKSWRQNKPADKRIPEVLWNVVANILSNPNYNRTTVTKGLGVSTAQLRDKFPEYFSQGKPPPVKKSNGTTFVKASLAPLIAATPLASTITIERHNGVKISIVTTSQEQFATLIKFFME